MLPLLRKTWTFSSCLPGYFGKHSFLNKRRETVSGIKLRFSPSNSGLLLPVTPACGDQRHQIKVLVDSGAAGNFMDLALAERLKNPSDPLPTPLVITAVDGRPLGSVTVTRLTAPLSLSVHQHPEELCLHLIPSPEFPVILGYPWLLRHNPHLDWRSGTVSNWGSSCLITCLSNEPSAPGPVSHEALDLPQVPSPYHHLKAVFSKRRATTLPPLPVL